ncbi:MAG: terminase [Methylobacter sp.]
MSATKETDQLIQLAADCSKDPHKWSLLAWDWDYGQLIGHPNPRAWQTDTNHIIRDHLQDPATRFQPLKIAVASGHGIGKTAEIGILVNWALSTCEDCKVVITANTEAQLRTKTSPEVGKWSRMSITADWFDVQSTSIASLDKEHNQEWRANFVTWSRNNTEAFAGLHNQGKRILLIFDEASAIDDSVWTVAEGALTDEQTEIIWIVFGNPTRNSGAFRECFRKNRHRWIHRQIDSRTVEGTNKAQIAKWIEDHGEDSDFVKVRVRGMFPNVSAKQFIATADVDAAFGREIRPESFNFAPKILTCDPAWQGDDDLVISMRQGLHFQILRVLPKNDNDIQVANILANLEDEHQADAVFIDAGYGTGIVSAGTTIGRDWTLVWSGSASSDPGCINKRMEMWKLIRDWLKSGGSIPKDQELYDELVSAETVPRLDGKMQMESKKDAKARGIPSPNKSDSLGLSLAFPVSKKQPGGYSTRTREQAIRGHDPFARPHR